jgi:hypothetical protein
MERIHGEWTELWRRYARDVPFASINAINSKLSRGWRWLYNSKGLINGFRKKWQDKVEEEVPV